MPKVKEFNVTIVYKPGALGRCFFALAERGIQSVPAFQSMWRKGRAWLCLWWTIRRPPRRSWGNLRMIFEETEAALVRIAHRPGALGRASARLGEEQVNIDYSYCGLEPGSAQALLVFGVDNLTRAAKALDNLAAEA